MTFYPNGIDDNFSLPPASGDDATSVNAAIGAIEAIETELGIVPSGVYANVRVRLDILEARINNPNAPVPDVLNPFFIGNTGVTIQAGIGDPNLVLAVPAPPGSLYLREDGYNIQGLYSSRTDGYWHQIDTDPWAAAGDLSGTIYSQTVTGLQGKPLPVPSGIGTALTWSGSVLGWTTVGGGGSPTGPAGGDLGSNYPNPSVLNINGTSVPATPSTNQVLVATSSTTAIWEKINDNQVAIGAAIQVSKLINGSTGQILITDVATPTWTTVGGDATISATGTITNTGLQSISVPAPSGTNTVLTYNAGVYSWAAGVSGGNIFTVLSTITATTYNVVSTDQFIPVDSTSNVVTITLPASPGTGEWHIIADISGTASTNNITVAGNGKNIVGSANFVINNAFNSIYVVYNGTNWSII